MLQDNALNSPMDCLNLVFKDTSQISTKYFHILLFLSKKPTLLNGLLTYFFVSIK